MKRIYQWLTTATLWAGYQLSIAQEPPDFLSIESASRRAYAQHDWQAVQATTRQALASKTDYLWLRQRAGISSYRQGNYRSSIKHLNAALRFDHCDTTALEFLYYSLLRDNQPAEAIARTTTLPASVQQRLGIRPQQFLTSVNLESGIKISTIPNTVGNVYYATLGLGHRISPAVQLSHSLTGLNVRYNQVLNVNQWQYSLRADVRAAASWLLSPGLQLIGASGTATFNTTMSQNGWVGQLSITRSGPGWKVYPALAISQISTAGTALTETGVYKRTVEAQWQAGVGGEYAVGRVRLYGSLAMQQQTKPALNRHPMGSLHTQVTLSPRLNVRVGYSYINTNHFLDITTGMFNNPPDPTVDKTTLLLTGQVTKRVIAYVLGQYERKTSATTSQAYAYQTGVGGLTILF